MSLPTNLPTEGLGLIGRVIYHLGLRWDYGDSAFI